MRCVDLDELLSAYADGQTLPAQTGFVELHLGSCARCRLVVQRYRETRSLLHLAADDWTPPDLRLRVAMAYDRQKRSRKRLIPGSITASVSVLVLTVGLLSGSVLAPRLGSDLAAQPAANPTWTATTPPCLACHDDVPARHWHAPRRWVLILAANDTPSTHLVAAAQPSPPALTRAPMTVAADIRLVKGGRAARVRMTHTVGLVAM